MNLLLRLNHFVINILERLNGKRCSYSLDILVTDIIGQWDNFPPKNRKIVLSVLCCLIYLCYIDEFISWHYLVWIMKSWKRESDGWDGIFKIFLPIIANHLFEIHHSDDQSFGWAKIPRWHLKINYRSFEQYNMF